MLCILCVVNKNATIIIYDDSKGFLLKCFIKHVVY